MAKNALQAQLLKAGLVDNKKASKLNKQKQHAKRTGQNDNSTQEAIAKAKAEKLAKDQQLNQERQKQVEEKALRASIQQMITQHKLIDVDGDVKYRFKDGNEFKSIYINQKTLDLVADGNAVIARVDASLSAVEVKPYAILPRPLGDRIATKMDDVIVVSHDKSQEVLDADDPYADYVIPDDLMW